MCSGNCSASELEHQQMTVLNLICIKQVLLNKKKKGLCQGESVLNTHLKPTISFPQTTFFVCLVSLCLTPKMEPWDVVYLCRDRGMLQSYEALCCKVTLLHSELKHQAGLIRKLRPLFNETRQGEARKHGGTPCHTQPHRRFRFCSLVLKFPTPRQAERWMTPVLGVLLHCRQVWFTSLKNCITFSLKNP